MKVEHLKVGLLLAIVILVCATAVSYFTLDHFYGASETGQKLDLEAQTTTESARVPSSAPFDVVPVSVIIGVSMAGLTLAVWSGSQVSSTSAKLQGTATTILLNEGLEDMTVRDVEIVSRMISKSEFTVPQLLRGAQVSRSSVWKLVKKMVDKGLVEETGKERLPDSGRGKPSKVYRYVGP